MRTTDVIVKPLMTEKATTMTQNMVYAFEVHEKTTKTQVAGLLEKLYGVKVGSVRIMMRRGKSKRSGKLMKEKKLPDRKIAYVRLVSGKIDIFPQA
jgi:large subunit ribosomal protein L23